MRIPTPNEDGILIKVINDEICDCCGKPHGGQTFKDGMCDAYTVGMEEKGFAELQVVLFFIGGSGAGVIRAVHKDLHAGRRASRAEEYQAEHRCRDGQQGRCRQCFFLHAAHLPRFFSGRLNPITKQPGKQPESRSGKAPPGCPGTPFPACREQSAVFPRFHKRKPGLNGLYAL